MPVSVRKILDDIGVQGAVTIALISSLRVVELYASRVFGSVVTVLLGPYAIYVQGLADEGTAGLLSAVLVVLIPRVGTLALSLVTISLLNGVLVGSLNITSAMYVFVAVIFYESAAAVLGVTTTERLRAPGPRAPLDVIVRVALALGIANAAKLCVQYIVYRDAFHLVIPDSFIVAVSSIVGFAYTAAGAAVGTILGYRLRRLTP